MWCKTYSRSAGLLMERLFSSNSSLVGSMERRRFIVYSSVCFLFSVFQSGVLVLIDTYSSYSFILVSKSASCNFDFCVGMIQEKIAFLIVFFISI